MSIEIGKLKGNTKLARGNSPFKVRKWSLEGKNLRN